MGLLRLYDQQVSHGLMFQCPSNGWPKMTENTGFWFMFAIRWCYTTDGRLKACLMWLMGTYVSLKFHQPEWGIQWNCVQPNRLLGDPKQGDSGPKVTMRWKSSGSTCPPGFTWPGDLVLHLIVKKEGKTKQTTKKENVRKKPRATPICPLR